nr:hypothetical protein [Bacillus sp. FJAT-18017]
MPVVYSPRATRSATVGTPLTWPELEEGIHPTDFTIKNIMKRIDEKGDIFQPVTTEKHNQPLREILNFIEKNNP